MRPTPPNDDAKPVIQRNPWVVGLLSFFTVSIYNFYLLFSWAKEINHLYGRPRHSPVVVLLVSILTLGIGACVFECVFAVDLGKLSGQHKVEMSFGSFSSVVIALNVSAVVLCLIPFGVILGFPVGVAATVLIQRELNRFVSPVLPTAAEKNT